MRRLFVLAVATSLACGGGGTEPPNPRAALYGTWTLQTVDGQALPWAEFPDLSLQSGTLTFSASAVDGSGQFVWTSPASGTMYNNETFGWGVDGTRIVFHYLCACARAFVPDTGTVSGTTLTVRRHFHDGVYVFRKQ